METKKPGIKRLFADIEVSPNIGLFWQAGFKLNISHENIIQERKVICIAYKWEGQKKITVLRWDSKQNDKAMLAKFLVVANEADEVVGHYLDFFDLPWFRTRCLFHGLEPLPPYKTIDTKAWASKYFYFNSNKLDYLSKFFGRAGKIKTDFQLWIDVTLKNSKKALDYMCRYCAGDIDELEFVFNKLKKACRPKSHVGVMQGLGKWSCPQCASENIIKQKTRTSASGNIQHQMQCRSCGSYFAISTQTLNAYKDYKAEKVQKVRCASATRNR